MVTVYDRFSTLAARFSTVILQIMVLSFNSGSSSGNDGDDTFTGGLRQYLSNIITLIINKV